MPTTKKTNPNTVINVVYGNFLISHFVDTGEIAIFPVTWCEDYGMEVGDELIRIPVKIILPLLTHEKD